MKQKDPLVITDTELPKFKVSKAKRLENEPFVILDTLLPTFKIFRFGKLKKLSYTVSFGVP